MEVAVSDKRTISPGRTCSGRELNGEGGKSCESHGAERNV